MLKIKDCLFNKDEIKYIEPYKKINDHCIYVYFKDGSYFIIYFYSQKERDKELNRVLKKVDESDK